MFAVLPQVALAHPPDVPELDLRHDLREPPDTNPDVARLLGRDGQVVHPEPDIVVVRIQQRQERNVPVRLVPHRDHDRELVVGRERRHAPVLECREGDHGEPGHDLHGDQAIVGKELPNTAGRCGKWVMMKDQS